MEFTLSLYTNVVSNKLAYMGWACSTCLFHPDRRHTHIDNSPRQESYHYADIAISCNGLWQLQAVA